MSKVMIVEDDDSLREIYGIRLTAEGYAVVSAHDGEEALAVAVRERPDLIISDVMMPKISGFDMLDILRSTPETANIRVIMMTALSSEDQRERGENLGADRYLVKSQVGIEDVVNTVHDVLGDRSPTGIINTDAPVTETPSPISTPIPADLGSTPVGFAPQTPTQAPGLATPPMQPTPFVQTPPSQQPSSPVPPAALVQPPTISPIQPTQPLSAQSTPNPSADTSQPTVPAPMLTPPAAANPSIPPQNMI